VCFDVTYFREHVETTGTLIYNDNHYQLELIAESLTKIHSTQRYDILEMMEVSHYET